MIRRAPSGVFNQFDLHKELQVRSASVKQSVEDLDADFLLASSTEDLAATIIGDFDLAPPELLWDQAEELPIAEAKADISHDYRYNVFDRTKPTMVPASRITIAVPVIGDVKMLGGKPNPWLDGVAPEAAVVGTELHVSHVFVKPDKQAIKVWWEREKQEITNQVSSIQSGIRPWREGLPDLVKRLVDSRRARLLGDRGLQGSLGLKVRVRDAGPRPVPVKRKKIATTRARKRANQPKFLPEPELEEQTYREVLDIICSFGRGLERSPRVAQKYNEEELRDQIIMQLNGHFEGEAGGELFNGAGKTDILIRQDDRNVFIGECKFWEGQKKFTDAVDQLGGYMVWRDTKAAIILFIKQQNPSVAMERARDAVLAHPQYKRIGPPSPDPSAYTTYILQHSDDNQREIHLALVPIIIRPEQAATD